MVIAQLTAELRADVRAGMTVASLSAGVTSGLGLLVAQIAYATFIFSGPLAPSSQGVGLVLFGNLRGLLTNGARTGSYRGVIAGLSPALVHDGRHGRKSDLPGTDSDAAVSSPASAALILMPWSLVRLRL